MPTIAESVQNLHDGATFLHGVATGPATGAGSQVTNPADATAQDSLAKVIADAEAELLTTAYLKALVKEVTDTSYICLPEDTGKIIILNNASDITITLPTGLVVGWNATFRQKGVGKGLFTESGTTLENYNNHTKTAGEKAVVTLFQDETNLFTLVGQTAS